MQYTKQILEITAIYVLPPLLIISGLLPRISIMPMLWIFFAYAFWYLYRQQHRLFAIDFSRSNLLAVFRRFLLIALSMIALLLLLSPESFLQMPRERTGFWLALLVIYPIASAFTQEVLFRTFFFERYARLYQAYPSRMTLLNVLLFSYVHLVFANLLAVVFTFIGGILFSHTYLKTRSTLLVSIEHALYGNALYTIGYGHFFYHNGTPLFQ